MKKVHVGGALALALVTLLACSGEDAPSSSGSGGSDAGGAGGAGGAGAGVGGTGGEMVSFPYESTLEWPGTSACGNTPTVYWPPPNAEYMAIKVAEITPPIEVRSITIGMFADGTTGVGNLPCSAATPFQVAFFVDPSTNALVWNAPDGPAWTPVQVREISGEDTPGQDLQYVTWTLDEPAVIEEAGVLWIGYQSSPQEGIDGTISCVAGCTDTDPLTTANAYTWDFGSGSFAGTNSHPYVTVTIGTTTVNNR